MFVAQRQKKKPCSTDLKLLHVWAFIKCEKLFEVSITLKIYYWNIRREKTSFPNFVLRKKNWKIFFKDCKMRSFRKILTHWIVSLIRSHYCREVQSLQAIQSMFPSSVIEKICPVFFWWNWPIFRMCDGKKRYFTFQWVNSKKKRVEFFPVCPSSHQNRQSISETAWKKRSNDIGLGEWNSN